MSDLTTTITGNPIGAASKAVSLWSKFRSFCSGGPNDAKINRMMEQLRDEAFWETVRQLEKIAETLEQLAQRGHNLDTPDAAQLADRVERFATDYERFPLPDKRNAITAATIKRWDAQHPHEVREYWYRQVAKLSPMTTRVLLQLFEPEAIIYHLWLGAFAVPNSFPLQRLPLEIRAALGDEEPPEPWGYRPERQAPEALAALETAGGRVLASAGSSFGAWHDAVMDMRGQHLVLIRPLDEVLRPSLDRYENNMFTLKHGNAGTSWQKLSLSSSGAMYREWVVDPQRGWETPSARNPHSTADKAR